MRRAVLALAVAAGTAHADPDPDPLPASVTATLRGSVAVLHARFALALEGPQLARATTVLAIPDEAAPTAVVVHAPDGVHRLALLAADEARTRFSAIDREGTGASRWAVLVEAQRGAIDISYAAPRTATVVLDVELELPTCFFRDARHARIPAAWRRALAPGLRAVPGRALAACDPATDDELWIALPTREVANRPAGAGRLAAHAARVDLGEGHLARLELALARRLGDLPRDLATAIVVDGSRSLTAAQREAQRAIALAYARAAGETRVQLVAYARTARALLPAWMTARTALPHLDRAVRAIAPRNGSNLDAGLVEAARWLARARGTRRVVLVTDERVPARLHATFDTLARLLPAGTLIHVVAVDEAGELSRTQEALGTALAESTGGIAVRVGADPDPDATPLVRPVRIDDLAIEGPGWRRFASAQPGSCGTTLDEGHGCTLLAEGDALAGPLLVEGRIWGRRVQRIVTPDLGRRVELARVLMDSPLLDDRARSRARTLARAANAAWAFYGAWGRPGGYEIGSMATRGSSCCDSASASHVAQVRVTTGRPRPPLPVHDLSPQFAHAVTRCGLGDAHVEAALELTGDEIVGVQVVAPAAVAGCVEDAIWDTALVVPPADRFRIDPRVVIVH